MPFFRKRIKYPIHNSDICQQIYIFDTVEKDKTFSDKRIAACCNVRIVRKWRTIRALAGREVFSLTHISPEKTDFRLDFTDKQGVGNAAPYFAVQRGQKHKKEDGCEKRAQLFVAFYNRTFVLVSKTADFC